MERRAVLTGSGVVLSTFLGGCLSSDSTPNVGVKNGIDPSPHDPILEYDTFQVGALRATHNPLDGSIASLDVFTTATEADEKLPLDDVDEELRFDDLAEGQEGTADEFVEQTEFNSGFLVSIITRWPKSNPSGIEILDVERQDNKITGTAEAAGEDPDVGDDAPTYPVTLVRVTVGDEHPNLVDVTITDGSGEEDTFDAPVN